LRITESEGSYDVVVNVHGGGLTGQAGAIVLGLSRALVSLNPDHESKLRDEHLLTRDPRKVERKKYGRAGARRRFQFSKR
jgi:small subunit ribosomal protein S9